MSDLPIDENDLVDIYEGFTVVSFGDLTTDVLLSIPRLPIEAGDDQIVHNIRIEPGGAGNFLICGVRLGLRMIALGVVGDDPFGSAALNTLMYEGVDIHRVHRQRGGTTTTVFVLVDEHGRHVFLGQYGSGTKLTFSAEWKQTILQADAVQVWGYTLQEERISEAMLSTMEYAHQNQKLVCLDPGPWMVDLPAERWQNALKHCQVLMLSETEIPSFAGKKGEWQAAGNLLAYGPHTVCVKRGERGCALITQAGVIEHPGFKVPVKDTTAAGDAFAAGFIYAYLNRWPEERMAGFANAVGAAKVQKFGSGSQVPTADDIRQLLKTQQIELDW